MAKADMLSRLINTLTKAEKRYFRMYTALQQGSKDYVNLFDVMEQQSFRSTAELKLAFHQQYPGCSYDVCSKYLYKVLLDCLLHLRLQKQSTAILTAGILKCDILFERSLHEDALKQLQKLQTTAAQHTTAATAELPRYYGRRTIQQAIRHPAYIDIHAADTATDDAIRNVAPYTAIQRQCTYLTSTGISRRTTGRYAPASYRLCDQP
jgi:hypothetical protein